MKIALKTSMIGVKKGNTESVLFTAFGQSHKYPSMNILCMGQGHQSVIQFFQDMSQKQV